MRAAHNGIIIIGEDHRELTRGIPRGLSLCPPIQTEGAAPWHTGRSGIWSSAGTSSSTSSANCSAEGSEPMPRKPKRPCSYPGCPNLTDGQYCEQHRKYARQQYDRYERAPHTASKYGRAWHRIRARYVAAHPLCEQCLKEGRITPVEEVHHIVPISKGGTHAEDNLMSLCQSCHTKIHHDLGDR